MVTRHAVLLNPALSVRGERYEVVEGKTPEISVKQARLLLKSLEASDALSKRDRAILAIKESNGEFARMYEILDRARSSG